jgi:hypothetical protein
VNAASAREVAVAFTLCDLEPHIGQRDIGAVALQRRCLAVRAGARSGCWQAAASRLDSRSVRASRVVAWIIGFPV